MQVCASMCKNYFSQELFFSIISTFSSYFNKKSLCKSYQVYFKSEQFNASLCKSMQVCASVIFSSIISTIPSYTTKNHYLNLFRFISSLSKSVQGCASLCKSVQISFFSTISIIPTYYRKNQNTRLVKFHGCLSKVMQVSLSYLRIKIINHVLCSYNTHQ